MKVFTLRFDPRIESFDDTALREFARDKETLSVRDHFFVKDDVPYWGVMLTYNVPPQDGDTPAARRQPPPEAKGKAGYRSILREVDWPLFNALRDWRSERAHNEGVPPYIVLTNDILAHVARERPQTLNALGQIRGLGEAKVKRYGRDLLSVVGAGPAVVLAASANADAGAAATEPPVPPASEPEPAAPDGGGGDRRV